MLRCSPKGRGFQLRGSSPLPSKDRDADLSAGACGATAAATARRAACDAPGPARAAMHRHAASGGKSATARPAMNRIAAATTIRHARTAATATAIYRFRMPARLADRSYVSDAVAAVAAADAAPAPEPVLGWPNRHRPRCQPVSPPPPPPPPAALSGAAAIAGQQRAELGVAPLAPVVPPAPMVIDTLDGMSAARMRRTL